MGNAEKKPLRRLAAGAVAVVTSASMLAGSVFQSPADLPADGVTVPPPIVADDDLDGDGKNKKNPAPQNVDPEPENPAPAEQEPALPEEEKKETFIAIYTDYPLSTGKPEGSGASFIGPDRIHWKDQTWRVVRVRDWESFGYYQAYAVLMKEGS